MPGSERLESKPGLLGGEHQKVEEGEAGIHARFILKKRPLQEPVKERHLSRDFTGNHSTEKSNCPEIGGKPSRGGGGIPIAEGTVKKTGGKLEGLLGPGFIMAYLLSCRVSLWLPQAFAISGPGFSACFHAGRPATTVASSAVAADFYAQ